MEWFKINNICTVENSVKAEHREKNIKIKYCFEKKPRTTYWLSLMLTTFTKIFVKTNLVTNFKWFENFLIVKSKIV